MKTKIFIGLILLIITFGLSYYFHDFLVGIVPHFDKIVIVLFAIIITYIISTSLNFVFQNIFKKNLKGDSLARKILPLLQNVSTIVIWIVGILMTLNFLGININALLTGAGIGGVVLALAGKEAASNLFGSLSLIFSKNFKIGDRIRVKGYEGEVKEITLSKTRLIDKNGNYVYIPNKNIIAEPIENFSQIKYQKISLDFNLSENLSKNDLKEKISTLENLCKKEKEILEYFIGLDLKDDKIKIIIEIKLPIESDLNNFKKLLILNIKSIIEK